jgi:hypothetical protein
MLTDSDFAAPCHTLCQGPPMPPLGYTFDTAVQPSFASSVTWRTLRAELHSSFPMAAATALESELQRPLVLQLRYGADVAARDPFFPRADGCVTEHMLAEAVRAISVETFCAAVHAVAPALAPPAVTQPCVATVAMVQRQHPADAPAHQAVLERVMRQNTLAAPPPFDLSVIVPATATGRRGQRPDLVVALWRVERVLCRARFGLPLLGLSQDVATALNALQPGPRVSWLELLQVPATPGSGHSRQRPATATTQGPPAYMRLETPTAGSPTAMACEGAVLTVALQWGSDRDQERFEGLYHCEAGHRSFTVQNGGPFMRMLDRMSAKASAGRHADTTPSVHRIRHMVFCALAEQWHGQM